MKRLQLLLIAAVAVLFFSCSQQNPVIELLPADTVMYVQVENPQEMISNVDGFLEESGLAPLMGGQSVEATLNMVFSELELSTKDFDMQSPIGFSFGTPDEWGDPAISMFVKTKSENVKKAFEEGAGLMATEMGGYLILSNVEQQYGNNNSSISTETLTQYASGSVSMAVDFDAFKRVYSDEYGELKEELEYEFSSGYGPESFILQAYMENVFSMLDSFLLVDANVIADKSGLAYSLGVSVDKANETAAGILKWADKNDANSYTKYIPADYLFGMAMNINSDAAKEMTTSYMNVLESLDLFSEDFMTVLGEYVDASAGVMGNYAATAIDVDVQASVLYNSDPTAMLDGIDFRMISVSALKDQDKYRSVIESMTDGKLGDALMKEIARLSYVEKAPLDLNFVLEKDKDFDGFKYDEFKFDISFNELAAEFGIISDGQADMANQTMEIFSEKFKIFSAYNNGKIYIVTADTGLEVLKQLATNDKAENSLASKGVLANQSIIANLNIGKAIKISEVMNPYASGGSDTLIDSQMVFQADIKDNRMSVNAFLSTESLKNMLDIVQNELPMILGSMF